MQDIGEVGNVHDRIVQLVDYFCKGNKAAFGRATNIQSGVLAGLIGGRKNKPSFEVLQKIFAGYPSINPTWLLFGRGPMLQEVDGSEHRGVVDPFSGSGVLAAHTRAGSGIEKWQDMTDRLDELTKRLDAIDEDAAELAVTREAAAVVYALTGEPNSKLPYDGLLTVRLGISEDKVRQLIDNKFLAAWHVGEVGPHTNWYTSEAHVRQFLARTPGVQQRARAKGK